MGNYKTLGGTYMTDKIQKSYYAIIPANVRYDKEISSSAKLLYGEITALCNEKGYCWASNEYFAELYMISKRQVSTLINQLVDTGYLHSELTYKNGTKQVDERRLYIASDFHTPGRKLHGGIEENFHTPGRKLHEGIEENFHTPIEENFQDNNTSFNNTFNTTFNNTKNKRKTAKAVFESCSSGVLLDSLLSFEDMRKQIKAPLTDKAAQMIVKKLNSMASDEITKVKILEQSIMNGWKSIYELKENNTYNKQRHIQTPQEIMARDLSHLEGGDVFDSIING